jgi:hypothetical protein
MGERNAEMRLTIAGAVAATIAAAVPHTFSPGQRALSSEVNANFTALDGSVANVAADLSALRAEVTGALATPTKVSTPESDINQLEDGTSPGDTSTSYCNGNVCVYRLVAGPFVLTNTEQVNRPGPPPMCSADGCPFITYIGRVLYFPARDDSVAASIAAGSAVPRWTWLSVSWSDSSYSVVDFGQTGFALRNVVRAGESLYSYHLPESPPPVASSEPDTVFVRAAGHWSGYHPY